MSSPRLLSSYFLSRTDAGSQLAAELSYYQNRPKTAVLAFTCNGLEVAAAVSSSLGLPICFLPAKSVFIEGENLLEVAVVVGENLIVHEEIVGGLELDQGVLDQAVEKTRNALASQVSIVSGLVKVSSPQIIQQYETLIVVQDLVAFGRRLRATLNVLREAAPSSRLVLASPVMDVESEHIFKKMVSEVICIRKTRSALEEVECFSVPPSPEKLARALATSI